VEFSLKGGANMNTMDENGHTPLHLAMRNNHRSVVELFLKADANVLIQNKQGKIALDLARALKE
jgi:ankyrin repeat protein